MDTYVGSRVGWVLSVLGIGGQGVVCIAFCAFMGVRGFGKGVL
jgi:hypothetical protein